MPSNDAARDSPLKSVAYTGTTINVGALNFTGPLCRKVPPSADTKASNVYAPGTTCKAGDPCTVCHTEFEAEGEVLQLPCEHCFHEGCILPWLELHHTCPICRAELPSEAGSAQGPVGTGPQGGNPHPQNDNAAPTIPTVEGLEAVSPHTT